MRNGRRVAAGAFAALLMVSGCSKVAEKAAEKATGCKNIDVNNGGGNVNCNGQNANIDVNGNAKLPSGFPAELAPPKGTKIYSAVSNKGTDGRTVFSITASVQGEPKAIAAGLVKQFKDAGYTIQSNSISSGSDGVGGNITAQGKKYGVTALFGTNTTGKDDGGTYITMNVRELSADELAHTTVPDTSGESSDPTETTEGNSSTSGQSLPDNFPSDLAPPDGTKILQATTGTYSGKNTWYVLAAVPGTVKDVTDGIKAQLTGAGFTIAYSGVQETSGYSTGTVSGKSDTLTAAISIVDRLASGTGDLPSGTVGVTFTLSEL